MRVFHQERFGGKDHAGRAEAALDRDLVDKGFLQCIQFAAGGKPFNRRDMTALELDRKDQAGVHRLVIEKNGAGTALPLGAALLGAGQKKILPQNVQKAAVRGSFQLNGLVVDKKVDCHEKTSS